MSRKHQTENSDHVAKIARDFGLADWQTLWNSNSSLRSRRANPNVLFKGDRVAKGDVVEVPNPFEKLIAKATGSSHKFQTKDPRIFLRLRILKDDFTPIKGAAFALNVDGVDLPAGKTDGNGQIEVEVAQTAQKATLTVRVPAAATDTASSSPPPGSKALRGDVPVTWNLQIGALNPILESAPTTLCASGCQQRFNNLGLNTGPVDGLIGPNTRSAIAAFCKIFNLKSQTEPTGEVQRKLKQVHDDPDSVLGPMPKPATTT